MRRQPLRLLPRSDCNDDNRGIPPNCMGPWILAARRAAVWFECGNDDIIRQAKPSHRFSPMAYRSASWRRSRISTHTQHIISEPFCIGLSVGACDPDLATPRPLRQQAMLRRPRLFVATTGVATGLTSNSATLEWNCQSGRRSISTCVRLWGTSSSMGNRTDVQTVRGQVPQPCRSRSH